MSENVVPKIIEPNPVWVDRRLVSFNHCHFANAVYVPETIEEHKARCEFVRRRLLLSAGLAGVTIPQNPACISEGKVYHGITIKEVEIETFPGLRLTGSLFLPEDTSKPVPGLLSPHGHWKNGRVHHAPNGGVVMRCFELARLGFAVFAYDMIGYNDNNDFPHSWDEELRRRGDLAGISTFGLQTANSMRAVDFIASLKEVDENRIGCTGASGGASQTWFIAALDKRIKVTVPVCMLSSHFMGGCPCEEGPVMRVTGLSSFDIVSAAAPRPVLLPGVTGDWTNLNPVYEIPALKKVYALYNVPERVQSFYYEDEHNYNRRTREHVYAYLMKELMGIDRGNVICEEEIPPPPPEMLWFGGVQPAAPTEESINTAFEKINNFLQQGVLDTGKDFQAFKDSRREQLRELLSTQQPPARDVVERVLHGKWDIPGAKACARTISRRLVGDIVTAVELIPEKSDGKNQVTVVICDGSYAEYFAGGKYENITRNMVETGKHAYIVELLGSGSNSWQLEYAIRDNSKLAAAFDEPFFSMRVQDIITVHTMLREKGIEDIRLLSHGKSALPVVLAAAALLDAEIECDFAGANENVWNEKLNFQPLIGRFGGLAALLLLNCSQKNIFHNIPVKYRQLLASHGYRKEISIMYKSKLTKAERLLHLELPQKKVRAVIDSDAATEIDDHFAISYALCAKDKIDVQAVIAAPFFKFTVSSAEEGMTSSYHAICQIFELLEEKSEGVVFKGAPHFMPDRNTPVDTEGARKIIELARRAKADGEILYIIAIAALTNVASAFLLAPDIIDCCTVVWLGGNAVEWPPGDNNEYNLRGDLAASQNIFDCGVPLVQFPCRMVTDHLITTEYELAARCRGCGKAGKHLYEYSVSEMKRWGNESRVIWDIVTVAYFCVPEAFHSMIRPAPAVNDDKSWDISDTGRHEMRYVYSVNRDAIFKDMYDRLKMYAAK